MHILDQGRSQMFLFEGAGDKYDNGEVKSTIMQP